MLFGLRVELTGSDNATYVNKIQGTFDILLTCVGTIVIISIQISFS